MGRPLENLTAVRTSLSEKHLAHHRASLINLKLHSLRSHPITFHFFPNAVMPRIIQVFHWNTLARHNYSIALNLCHQHSPTARSLILFV